MRYLVYEVEKPFKAVGNVSDGQKLDKKFFVGTLYYGYPSEDKIKFKSVELVDGNWTDVWFEQTPDVFKQANSSSCTKWIVTSIILFIIVAVLINKLQNALQKT